MGMVFLASYVEERRGPETYLISWPPDLSSHTFYAHSPLFHPQVTIALQEKAVSGVMSSERFLWFCKARLSMSNHPPNHINDVSQYMFPPLLPL